MAGAAGAAGRLAAPPAARPMPQGASAQIHPGKGGALPVKQGAMDIRQAALAQTRQQPRKRWGILDG
jgi:hypothetical protein